MTLGSITADATYGSNTEAAPLIRDRRDGACARRDWTRDRMDWGNRPIGPDVLHGALVSR